MEPLLKATNLSKSFGTLPAVQQINLELSPGEVIGLAGESGSGKSALCMLLAGMYAPSEGEIVFAGNRLRGAAHARALGIQIVQRTPELADRMDVTRNIFLGNEICWSLLAGWPRVLNWRRMDREAERILEEIDLHVNSLRTQVANLTSEQRQLLIIGRLLTYSCRMIIFDDAGVLLSYPTQQKVLSLIQKWQEEGTAVIISSNNLDHLLAVTDRILVLRQGRQVAEFQTDKVDREQIVAAMVGTTDHQELTPVIWALDNYYRAREQADQLYQRQALLERDLATQDTLKRQLIEQLGEQIRALDSANAALQDAQRRLLTEREAERKRLAREIHDQVIQDLLSVNYELEEIETEQAPAAEEEDRLIDVRENIRSLIEDLRGICGNLRPPTIDSLGLGAALQSYTHDWTRRTGIEVALDLDPNLGRLPEDIELSIFRIIQEGLSNIRKHAAATAVQISLKHTSPRALMVSIGDNGRGLPEGSDLATLSSSGHYGLLDISERVALLGGKVRLQNRRGGGLLLQAEIPHPRSVQP